MLSNKCRFRVEQKPSEFPDDDDTDCTAAKRRRPSFSHALNHLLFFFIPVHSLVTLDPRGYKTRDVDRWPGPIALM